jgi:hypothetical protein
VARDVKQNLRDNATDVTAGDAAQETPTLTASQTFEQALAARVRSNARGIAGGRRGASERRRLAQPL